ncbi:zinc-binding dehydrogenase [Streptomyces sp. NPDC057199]|uniref:zinc-binding dehydrogenase n=1 Tax=Streptomyces sp. NPDC057199 TaxID=3346047 RepID=UPI0036371C04
MNTEVPMMSESMKAVVFYETGGLEVLRYEDVPKPQPGPGEVLIRVEACSLNRGPDTMVRGGVFPVAGISFPHVSGADPAGQVTALGEGVNDVAVGSRVAVHPLLSCETWCTQCPALGENYCGKVRLIGVHRWGGHAEYVSVPARNVVPLPDEVSYMAAATLGVSYVTAWHGMVTQARTTASDTVLVMAAGSAVGAAAIQIGKLLGARVIAATSKAGKMSRARELGADDVVDSSDPEWSAHVKAATNGRGVTVLFDNIGAETWTQSLDCLARGARVFCSGASGNPEVTINLRTLYRKMVTFHFHMQGTKAEVGHLADLMAAGQLAPVIDRTYPFAHARDAHARLAAMDQFGKIILVPS